MNSYKRRRWIISSFSNFLEENLQKHVFRTGSYTKPTVLSIVLLTTLAVDADTGQFTLGTGVEVSNSNGYSRKTLNPSDANWSDPATGTQGQVDNSTKITFGPASGGDWGTIVGIAICDSAVFDSGNLLYHGALSTSKVVSDADTFEFNIGDLNISLD